MDQKLSKPLDAVLNAPNETLIFMGGYYEFLVTILSQLTALCEYRRRETDRQRNPSFPFCRVKFKFHCCVIVSSAFNRVMLLYCNHNVIYLVLIPYIYLITRSE